MSAPQSYLLPSRMADPVSTPPDDGPLVGTDTLGRPLTTAEKMRFERVLRRHDFVAVRLIALRFAHTKTRNRAQAEDVMNRVVLRLVRQGWDPGEVPLVKRLCRLVWSEWTHEVEEQKAQRHAEEMFLARMAGHEPAETMPADEAKEREERREKEHAHAEAQTERLRQAFRASDDEVNLEYLHYRQEGIESLEEMARRSQRGVEEFYRATDRRKRAVKRLLVEAKGVTLKEKP